MFRELATLPNAQPPEPNKRRRAIVVPFGCLTDVVFVDDLHSRFAELNLRRLQNTSCRNVADQEDAVAFRGIG